MQKVLIYSRKESNILDSIIRYMESEQIDFVVENNIKNRKGITDIIYIKDNFEEFDLEENLDLPVILISSKKQVIKSNSFVNYIITDLVNDETNYTDVQKEYLLKKGIYHILAQKIGELLENINNYNGMIYDFSELKLIPDNWIFGFDSINDTYAWLSKKNKSLPDNFTRKVVNFYSEKVYDDSLREINYLTEKVMEIKDKLRVIDIFICTKDELIKFRENYFFKLLIKNISETYKFYLVDREKLLENDKNIFDKLLDGIAIYNDCVYRDTYDDEFSLGYVDCNDETIREYNYYFDYVIKNYGHEIITESDLDEF